MLPWAHPSPQTISIGSAVLGRPFVKRFALCYQTVFWLSCPVCPVCDGVLWPNGWTNQDETWHGGRPRPWPHCVSSPSPKGHSPQFSAHICCGKMAGWIKMPLGRTVGFNPSDIVLDGDPAPSPQKGAEPRNFRPMSILAKWSPISATAEHL